MWIKYFPGVVVFWVSLAVAQPVPEPTADAENPPSPMQVLDHPEVQGAWAAVDAWIDGVRDYEEVPGISVGLVVDQDLVLSKGYGYSNLRKQLPADADTIYSICSISKLFTAVGVMQQRDAGKLSLRDPVQDHLPWLPLKAAHGEFGPARLMGLLTHSSGLPREVDLSYWVDKGHPFPDRDTMLERLQTQETLYPADERFQYSNLGLTLAGEVITEVTGQPYNEYVREHIIDPLGLTDTRPEFPKKLHGKQMAIGYTGFGRDRKRNKIPPFDAKALSPAFGFTSTVNDLARFASWQFRALEGQDESVLARNTLREMQRVHWVDPDGKISWGIGFSLTHIDGVRMVGHGGGCPGYITSFQMAPSKKVAAIALTNAGDGPAFQIAQTMMQTLGPAFTTALQSNEADVSDNNKTESEIDLDDYVGNYGGSVWGGETAVRIWGDQLVLLSLPADNLKEMAKLKHHEADVFVRQTDEGEPRESWRFVRDEAGQVVAVTAHSQTYQRL
ncbi:MAG: serine hydrolase [Pseudomonadota bacterium]